MKIEIRCEGYLGRDFELKQSNRTNTPFAVGSLGVSGVLTNGNQPINNNFNDNEPTTDDNTTVWFDLSLFGEQVQQTYQYFQKGMRVEVVGTLTFSTFIDRSNQTRESKRIFVREIRHVCQPALGPELLNIQRQAASQRQQNQGNFNNNRYNSSNNYNNQGSFGNSNQGNFGNNNQGSFGNSNQGGFGNNNQAGFGNSSFGGNNNQSGFGNSSSSSSSSNFSGSFGEGNINSFTKNNNNFGSSSFPNSSESKTSKNTDSIVDDSDDVPF